MNYHVKRTDRAVSGSDEMWQIIQQCTYGILGLSKDNEPYLVALSYGHDRVNQALYFHCAPEGQKIDFIRANSRACVSIVQDFGYQSGSCDHSYRSVVLKGEVSVVDDKEEVEQAIRLMIGQLEKKEPDKALAKISPDNKSYTRMKILKFSIRSMAAKAR